MISQNHIIRSITFDTALANEELVDPWRNTISRISVESVFGRVLQDYDLQKEWTCIDKLEIDLGEMGLENEDEWNYRIAMALEEILSKKIRPNHPDLHSMAPMTTSYKDEVSNVVITDDDNYRMNALVAYLETGISPWQLPISEDAGQVLLELAVKKPALVEEHLRQILQRFPSAADRLMMVLDFQQLTMVIKLFVREETVAELISLYAAIEKFCSFARRKIIKEKMIREFLKCAFTLGGDVKKMMETLLTNNFPALFEVAERKRIKMIIDEQIGSQTELARIVSQTIESIGVAEENNVLIVSSEMKEMVPQKVYEMISKSEDKSKCEIVSESEKEKKTAETQDEVIFIYDAGIVLLNPGLIKYHFEKLGWIQENEFRSVLARKKAVLWLHYLTHGDQKIREYDLSLVKVLCGHLPSDIADVKLRLTKKERQEADGMLESVIDSWAALKKVSLEGFRQSFLQREGRLTQDEAGWQLHVRSRAYDILIDQLPWSYSIIKFPWMLKPLFTQWSTRI